jgi:Tol biopolymer transport system component
MVPSAWAQPDDPSGQMAFVRNGNIWLWTPDRTEVVMESGNAMDASLSPEGDAVSYVEHGGSYSNLMIYDRKTERSVRVTDNESFVENGSPDYVASSSWAIDPSWSESGVIGFISDRGSPERLMQLWLMREDSSSAFLAPTDGRDAGSIEHLELSRDGNAAVYTVLAAGGELGGTTYVALRNLQSGATYPIVEGVQGAYDPTLSPDGSQVVVSIRDQDGVSDLWIVDVQTGVASRLTDDLQATNATWSPDGTWLAYMTPSDQSFTIWVARIDAKEETLVGEPRKLVEEAGIDATSGLSWID